MSIATEGMPNPRFEFGDRIRKVRRDIAHMTQAEMANALGVTQKAYAAWESGGKPGDIVAIARRVEQLWPGQVTAAWVMGVEDPTPPPPAHPFIQPRAVQVAPVRRLRSAGSVVGGGREVHRDLVRAQTDDVDDDAIAYLRLADPATNEPCPHQDSNLGPADYETAA